MNKYVKKGLCLVLATGLIASSFAGYFSTHIFIPQTYLINRITLYIINLDKYTQNK